jgi:3-methylcrotonyl-CoA carboxylase alpha subunit
MKKTFRDGAHTREVEIRSREKGRAQIAVGGEPLDLGVEPLGDGHLRLATGESARVARVTRVGRRVFVSFEGREFVFEELAPMSSRRRRDEHHEGEISMPMPGKVVRVHVRDGESVTRGQPLVVVEAMKMEHTLRAPRDGVVRRVAAEVGVLVDAGAALMEVAS